MDLLYKSELKDPSSWVLQNAQTILDSVKKFGGWAAVFDKGVPTWLHKLRNYFNVEPKTLRLVDASVTKHWMQTIQANGQLGGIVGGRTLSGHVYFDQDVEVWYQMGPGGSIYHWGSDVKVSWLEAGITHAFRGQTGIPIFKLICPDGTGGSKETIVSNPKVNKVPIHLPHRVIYEMQGSEKIGEVNDPIYVGNRLVTTMRHQGSYNFSETSVVGLDSHKTNDVKTHEKDAVYIDPPDRFAPLKERIFNEFVLHTAGATINRSAPRGVSQDFDEPPDKPRNPHAASRP